MPSVYKCSGLKFDFATRWSEEAQISWPNKQQHSWQKHNKMDREAYICSWTSGGSGIISFLVQYRVLTELFKVMTKAEHVQTALSSY